MYRPSITAPSVRLLTHSITEQRERREHRTREKSRLTDVTERARPAVCEGRGGGAERPRERKRGRDGLLATLRKGGGRCFSGSCYVEDLFPEILRISRINHVIICAEFATRASFWDRIPSPRIWQLRYIKPLSTPSKHIEHHDHHCKTAW